MGRVFVTGRLDLGPLYMIDPTQPPGAVTTVASNVGNRPAAIAFDGAKIWSANFGSSVSIITPGGTPPWPVTTVSAGFAGNHNGVLYDGVNFWVALGGANKIARF